MEKFESACITGGAGFIGGHIAESLCIDDIKIYDNFSNSVASDLEKFDVIDKDVRDVEHIRSTINKSDIVFHEAAQVSVEKSINGPVISHEINLDPILTILEAARDTETRIVFASSAAIYGQPEYTPIDENHRKEPTSPYGLEKLTADHYCRLYHEIYGVEAVALRYFNVYGPGQQAGDYSGVIANFREQALNDDPITIEGDGSQTRDFVHVEDVVQANILAATHKDAPGKAFNVGTGTETSILRLAKTIKEVTNSNSEIVNVEPREGDIDKSIADITRTRDTLGYQPKYDIHDGIQAYLGE